MKTTLFTGAGASKAIGYPLTSELLPMIRDRIKSEDLFEEINDRRSNLAACRKLHSYLGKLLPGFDATKREDLPLITDVFSMAEYSLAAGESLPVGGMADLIRFRDLLKQAIAIILIDQYLEAWNQSGPAEKTAHDGLIRWMRNQGSDIAMVTTNYDIEIDRCFYKEIENDGNFPDKVDLGFNWRWHKDDKVKLRPTDPRHRFFKLHGSLDLLRCSACGHVYFNERGTIAHQAMRDEIDEGNSCECSKQHRLELHIVSPSHVRDIRDGSILNVWQSAFEWMRTSDRWVIAGYSLPPEDLAIRSLLVRAYHGRKKPPEVIVVQQGESLRSRYSLYFPNCRYFSDGLAAALEQNLI